MCAHRAGLLWGIFFALGLTVACGGSSKEAPPPQEKPAAPRLAPLAPVVNADRVTVRGLAGAEGEIVVRGGVAEARGPVAAGTLAFGVEVPLALGANALEVRAVANGVESEAVAASVSYARPTLTVTAATPADVSAGSFLTLQGTGFGTDPDAVAVWLSDGAREASAAVRAVSGTSLRVVVPFAFMDSSGTLTAFVATAAAASNTVSVAITPLADETPAIEGDQTEAHLTTLRDLVRAVRERLEAERDAIPNVSDAAWTTVFRDLDNVEAGMDEALATWLPRQTPEALAVFDRMLSSGVVRDAEARLRGVAAGGKIAPFRGQGVFALTGDAAFTEAMCDVQSVTAVLSEVVLDLELILGALAAAEVVCSFVCWGALPALSTAIAILSPIVAALSAVDAILTALVPDHPSNFHMDVRTPYPGGDPWVLFTGTTNQVALRIDLSNGGYRKLINEINFMGSILMQILSIDLPPPYVIEDQPVGSLAQLAAGQPLTKCSAPYADVDAPAPLSLPNGDVGSEWKDLYGVAVTETDKCIQAPIYVHGTCGPFAYPENTCPQNLPGQECAPPPTYRHVQVIEAPVVLTQDFIAPPGLPVEDYGRWYITGIGFNQLCGVNFKIYWDGEEVPCACIERLDVRLIIFKWECHWLREPGRLQLEAILEGGESRRGPEIPMPPGFGTDGVVLRSLTPPSAFVGDTVVMAGRGINATKEDDTLSFIAADGTTVDGIAPDAVQSQAKFPGYDAGYDLLTFTVPEQIYKMQGQQLTTHLHVEPVHFSGLNDGEIPFSLMRSESARWLDQDLVAWDVSFGYLRSAVIADLDGDGANDLAVGVPGSMYATQGNPPPTGAVYVAFGPLVGLESLGGQRVLDLDGTWDVKIEGDPDGVDQAGGNSRRIGQALAAGDVDGDGTADLLVGSTDQDEDDRHRTYFGYASETGHLRAYAYLFEGRSREEWRANGGHYSVAAAAGSAHGPSVTVSDAVGELGYAVALGDLNGDGRDDLVLGAPTDAVDPAVPNDTHAMTYLIFGSASLPASIDVQQIASSVPGATFRGPTTAETPEPGAPAWIGNGLGKGLAVGDVDGDGVEDLLVGAPESSRDLGDGAPLTLLRKGAAFLYRGGASIAGHHAAQLTGGDAALAIAGPPEHYAGHALGPSRAIGKSLAIGNLSRPGVLSLGADLVLGAPEAKLDRDLYFNEFDFVPVHVDHAGAVYVLSRHFLPLGQPGTAIGVERHADLTVRGSPSLARLGAQVAVADLDGDGRKDLVASAPMTAGGDRAGAVWVLYGEGAPWWYPNPPEPQTRHTLHLLDRFAIGAPGSDGSPPSPQPNWRDLQVRGEYAHAGRHGFGTFVTLGRLGPHRQPTAPHFGEGNDLLVADPLSTAPGAHSGAGQLYEFYEGPASLLTHADFAGVAVSGAGTAELAGDLHAAGEDAGYQWPCDARPANVALDRPEPHVYVLDQRNMILGEGHSAVANVTTPASGACRVLVRAEAEAATGSFGGTLQLGGGQALAPWARQYVTGATSYPVGAVDVADDGSVVLAGRAVTPGGNRAYVMKLDARGDVAWRTEMPIASGAPGFTAVRRDLQGNYVAAGRLTNDLWVVKLDGAGALDWHFTYGWILGDQGLSLVPAVDGVFVVATTELTSTYWRAMKLGLDGTPLWRRDLGGPLASTLGGAVLSNGELVVAGYTASFGSRPEPWIVALGDDGAIRWQWLLHVGSPDLDVLFVAPASGGGAVLAGHGWFADVSSVWAARVNPNGLVRWGVRGVAHVDLVRGLAETPGGYAVFGGGAEIYGQRVLMLDRLSGAKAWAKEVAFGWPAVLGAASEGPLALVGATAGTAVVTARADGTFPCGMATDLGATVADLPVTVTETHDTSALSGWFGVPADLSGQSVTVGVLDLCIPQ